MGSQDQRKRRRGLLLSELKMLSEKQEIAQHDKDLKNWIKDDKKAKDKSLVSKSLKCKAFPITSTLLIEINDNRSIKIIKQRPGIHRQVPIKRVVKFRGLPVKKRKAHNKSVS